MLVHNIEENMQVSVSMFFCFSIHVDHMFSHRQKDGSKNTWSLGSLVGLSSGM